MIHVVLGSANTSIHKKLLPLDATEAHFGSQQPGDVIKDNAPPDFKAKVNR